jgi:hypothetical protein
MFSKLFGKLAGNKKLMLEVYKDGLQPGVQQVGAAIGNSLAFLLYGVSKVPKYLVERWDIALSGNLEKYRCEMESIPIEKVTRVPSEIAVPVLEKLNYVKDDDLSQMFINLLTKASVDRTNNLAHPSFVQRISNLTSDEAKILYHIHDQGLHTIPFVVIWMQFEQPHGLQKSDRLTGFERIGGLLFPQNVSVYMENLVSLGMLICNDLTMLSNEAHYAELNALYEAARKHVEDLGHEDGNKYPVILKRGYYDITNYGRMFLSACVEKIAAISKNL